MFLKGDIPTEISAPQDRAEKWRKLHRKRRDHMLQMKNMFVKAGTKRETEAYIRAQREVISHQKANLMRQDESFDEFDDTAALSTHSSSGAQTVAESNLPYLDIYTDGYHSAQKKKRKQGRQRRHRSSSGNDRSSRDNPEAKTASLAPKFSGARNARDLCTVLKQLYKAIEKAGPLRMMTEVEAIYDEIEKRQRHLIKMVRRIQKLLVAAVNEGRAQHRKVTIEKCLGLLVKILGKKDQKSTMKAKRTCTDLELFFLRIIAMLNGTEKDILWLLLKKCQLFEPELTPSDPLIACSMLVRLLHQKSQNLRLPSLSSAVNNSRKLQVELSEYKRRPSTIPQMRRKSKATKGSAYTTKWEAVAEPPSRADRRTSSLPRIKERKKSKKKKVSSLQAAIDGPLSFTLQK